MDMEVFNNSQKTIWTVRDPDDQSLVMMLLDSQSYKDHLGGQRPRPGRRIENRRWVERLTKDQLDGQRSRRERFAHIPHFAKTSWAVRDSDRGQPYGYGGFRQLIKTSWAVKDPDVRWRDERVARL